MIQLLFCLFLLTPVVVAPVIAFSVSDMAGAIVSVISLILFVPLALAAYAHLDLLLAKSRFGLSDEELDDFSRLVPRLAAHPDYASLSRRQLRRSTKRAAADIIGERRARVPAQRPQARR
jgi:hypothetical protein